MRIIPCWACPTAVLGFWFVVAALTLCDLATVVPSLRSTASAQGHKSRIPVVADASSASQTNQAAHRSDGVVLLHGWAAAADQVAPASSLNLRRSHRCLDAPRSLANAAARSCTIDSSGRLEGGRPRVNIGGSQAHDSEPPDESQLNRAPCKTYAAQQRSERGRDRRSASDGDRGSQGQSR